MTSDVAGLAVESQLKDLSREWMKAEVSGDVAYIEHTLADDFLAIGPRGYMLNKEDWLARYRSGDLKNDSLSLDDVRVRVYGDAAVVTGIELQKGTYKNQPIPAQLRTSLVWVRQGEVWRLAGAQMSPLSPAP